MNMGPGGASSIHQAGCDVWKIPKRRGTTSPDCIEATLVDYVASIDAPYRALNNASAQLAALLLLSLHPASPRSSLSRRSISIDIISDALAHLGTTAPPRVAEQHHWLLRQAGSLLQDSAMILARESITNWRRDTVMRDKARELLRRAHRLLHLTALPFADLTTVDLTDACCSCTAHLPRMIARES